MAELAGVAFADIIGQFGEQGEAGGGNADHDGAAVVGRAGALDQLALMELVEQTGNVRGEGDEPRGEGQSGKRLRISGLEQPQGVVLLGGQVGLVGGTSITWGRRPESQCESPCSQWPRESRSSSLRNIGNAAAVAPVECFEREHGSMR